MPKISELPVASVVGTSDLIPVVQGGVTKQAAASTLPGNTGHGIVLDPGDSIQAALDAGNKMIYLNPGQWDITSSINIDANDRGVRIQGAGQQTRIRATSSMGPIFYLSGDVDGVQISSLVMDCNNQATRGIDSNIVRLASGTGFYKGEPDAVCRYDNLWVYSATQDGIVLRGQDTQATHLHRIRVRGASRYGYRIEAADNLIVDCEATTATDYAGSSGIAAGFYVGTALFSEGGMGGSNNHFRGCKAWYVRGYGFHVRGTRNFFVSCESQDTKYHGWYLEWDKNSLTGCIADSAGYGDVGGAYNTQDGFYLAAGLQFTTMTGCLSFDREQGYAAQQRYGYNMSASTYNIGRSTSATTAGTGTGTTPPLIGTLAGGNTTESGWKNVSGLLNLR